MKYFCRIYFGLSIAYFFALTLLPNWEDPVYDGLPMIIRDANWAMLAVSIIVICVYKSRRHEVTPGKGVFLASAVCSIPSIIGSLLRFDLFFHPLKTPYDDITGGVLDRAMLYWIWYAWFEIIGIAIYAVVRFAEKKAKKYRMSDRLSNRTKKELRKLWQPK